MTALVRASASLAVAMAFLVRQPPAAGRQPIEVFELPPLRLYLCREPPRLSFHLDGKLLVAQRPRRERGSMEFLLESGWRAARALRLAVEERGLRGELILEGGREAQLCIERGPEGDLLVEVSGPPGTLAVRDDLLRYHAERLLGVEGVRWDDPAAPPGPEDEVLKALHGGRSFISSRGYGVLVDAQAPGPDCAPRIHSPDPDSLRIEARGGRLAYRLLPGPEPRRILERRARRFEDPDRRAEIRHLAAALARPIRFWSGRPADRDLESDLALLSRVGIVPGAVLFAQERGGAIPLLPEKFPSSLRIATSWGGEPSPVRVRVRELPLSFAGLRRAAREAQTLSVLGIPFAGFRFLAQPSSSSEVLSRSIQLSTFLPVQVLEAGGASPGPELSEVLSRCARVRREIVAPLFERSEEEGLPAICPLFLAEPPDLDAWSVADEWLIGDSLLAAPVLEEGARTRDVRLPAGEWEDLWAGKGGGPVFKGPSTVKVETPPEKIPAFLRR